MRSFTVSSVIVAVAMASAVTPMTLPAAGETVVFTAQLLPGNQVPPITNADATGSGAAAVTIDLTRDSQNNITAATARFDVAVAGLPPTDTVVLAHVHREAVGVNGPIVIDSGITQSNPVPLTNGAATFTRTGLPVNPDDASAIIASPAGFYFNVHTNLNPGGALRGQLGQTRVTLTTDRDFVYTEDQVALYVQFTTTQPGVFDVFVFVDTPVTGQPGFDCAGGAVNRFYFIDNFRQIRHECFSPSGVHAFHALFRGVPEAGGTSLTLAPLTTLSIPPGIPSGPYTFSLLLTPPNADADGVLGPADVSSSSSAVITILP